MVNEVLQWEKGVNVVEVSFIILNALANPAEKYLVAWG